MHDSEVPPNQVPKDVSFSNEAFIFVSTCEEKFLASAEILFPN